MKYRVKMPIYHGTTDKDQRRYEPGESIELRREQAAPLILRGAVEAAHPPVSLAINPVFTKGGDSQ